MFQNGSKDRLHFVEKDKKQVDFDGKKNFFGKYCPVIDQFRKIDLLIFYPFCNNGDENVYGLQSQELTPYNLIESLHDLRFMF